jgi:hypothetical protein
MNTKTRATTFITVLFTLLAIADGPPWPPGATNGVPDTNGWSGTNFHILDTGARFGADSNHYYTLQVKAELPAAWQDRTNFIGPKTFTLYNTNQAEFARLAWQGFVIYSRTNETHSGSNSQAGNYVGFARYDRSVVDGWGWSTGASNGTFTVQDITRTDTRVVSFDLQYSITQFGLTPMTGTNHYSPDKERFIVYFPSNMPAAAFKYPLWLKEGFAQ